MAPSWPGEGERGRKEGYEGGKVGRKNGKKGGR